MFFEILFDLKVSLVLLFRRSMFIASKPRGAIDVVKFVLYEWLSTNSISLLVMSKMHLSNFSCFGLCLCPAIDASLAKISRCCIPSVLLK